METRRSPDRRVLFWSLPAETQAGIDGSSDARLVERGRGGGDRRNAGAGDIFLVRQVAGIDEEREILRDVVTGPEAEQGVIFCLLGVGIVDVIGLRHPFHVRPGIEAKRALVEQFGPQEVTRRAGQLVVTPGRVSVEAEIAEGVGGVDPELVFRAACREQSLDRSPAKGGFNTLMDRLVGIGDAVLAATKIEILELVLDMRPVDGEVPSKVLPRATGADFQRGCILRIGVGKRRVGEVQLTKSRGFAAPRQIAEDLPFRPATAGRVSG